MNKAMKLTPELRFPEYAKDGEWVNKALGDIADRITDKVGDKKLTTVSISAGLGFVSQAEKFSRDISGKQYKNYIFLKQGEFAFNKGNSKKFPQGCIYKLKEFEEAAAPSAFICFRFKKTVVPDFYQGYFDKNYHGRQLQKFITSGARMDGLLNISPNDFFNIILPTPKNIEEQLKIAACLTSLDELITAHNDKLEALKDHKNGLMQNLFPQDGQKAPNYRFHEFKNDGKWVKKNLEDVCEINPKVGELPKDFIYVDLESVNNGVLLKRNFINKKGAPSRAQRLLQDNDIIYQMVRPYQKNNYYFVKDDRYDYVASTGYAQLRAYETARFLFQLIHTDEFVSNVLEKCTGSNYPAINTSALKKIDIKIPSTIQEQQKIASCLSAIDELIGAQSQTIEKLQLHKKGLMQGLFPKIENL